ncbi:MAG: carbamoyltransferase HypF, partial [Simkaniaceae bacterium]|nr:carbamoyltransferase HypF [Simkaniaceae bacterium]
MDSTSSGKIVASTSRYKILINGIVQGVGFRPFIYNLAHSYHLCGFVINTATGVEIQAEGNHQTIKTFIDAIQQKAPPLAIILDQSHSEIPPTGENDFTIRSSEKSESVTTFISPDISTCEDCRVDFSDPTNRRYGYPFTNCTNCGPRYTIIEDIPYDRPKTSMRNFPLCPECQFEYDNPTDRRFHAQPNACPVCGPHVELWQNAESQMLCDDPIAKTAQLLNEGKIVAIKGLGGFHLAVDATNNDAVQELRRRKHREEKPLAIMVKDVAAAKQ